MLQPDKATNHKQESASYDPCQAVSKQDLNEHKRNWYEKQQPTKECMASNNVQLAQGL